MHKECDVALAGPEKKGMFSALMPMLLERTIVMTISHPDAEKTS